MPYRENQPAVSCRRRRYRLGPGQRSDDTAGASGGALGELGATYGRRTAWQGGIVEIWEYTCINWIRTLPFVKAWNRDYGALGLVVVGVHAPEFEFGKRAENIDRAIRDHGLTYPIAIDNEFAIWRALSNDAWPAKYLFDGHGRLVKRWAGEGDYDEIESEIDGFSSPRTLAFSCRLSVRRQRGSREPASLLTRESRTKRMSEPTDGSPVVPPSRATGEPNASTSSSGRAQARSRSPSLAAKRT